jgi:hypothetical protein
VCHLPAAGTLPDRAIHPGIRDARSSLETALIPLNELAAELVLAVGAALFAANLWVLLRPVVQRPKKGKRLPRPPSMTRIYVNLVIGAAASTWAIATLITQH